MSGELSGLELRKALYTKWASDSLVATDRLPAVESDPAVSEPMLDEFCRERNYGWNVELYCRDGCCPSAAYICSIGRPTDTGYEDLAEAAGSTPSEARARAMLAVLAAEGR